jgi:hypothetical protein
MPGGGQRWETWVMRARTRLTAAVLVGALAVVPLACGDGDSSDGAAVTTSTRSASQSTSETERSTTSTRRATTTTVSPTTATTVAATSTPAEDSTTAPGASSTAPAGATTTTRLAGTAPTTAPLPPPESIGPAPTGPGAPVTTVPPATVPPGTVLTVPVTEPPPSIPDGAPVTLPPIAVGLPAVDAACASFVAAEQAFGPPDLVALPGQLAWAAGRAERLTAFADDVAATGAIAGSTVDALRAAADAYRQVGADPAASAMTTALTLLRAEVGATSPFVQLVTAGARGCAVPTPQSVTIPTPTVPGS